MGNVQCLLQWEPKGYWFFKCPALQVQLIEEMPHQDRGAFTDEMIDNAKASLLRRAHQVIKDEIKKQ